MRADNTAALGRAPAWEQGSGSSCGYREFHSKPGEEIGGKKLSGKRCLYLQLCSGLIHTHLGCGTNASKC